MSTLFWCWVSFAIGALLMRRVSSWEIEERDQQIKALIDTCMRATSETVDATAKVREIQAELERLNSLSQ